MIQNKIDHLTDTGSKNISDLIKKRGSYYNNNEFVAAQAIGLQNFNDDGNLGGEKKETKIANENVLVPFNQAYRSPFL